VGADITFCLRPRFSGSTFKLFLPVYNPHMSPDFRPASALRLCLAVGLVLLPACRTAGPVTTAAPAPRIDAATAAARQALANEISLDVRSIPERAIAVPALSVSAADTALAPLGFGLADMMITDLSKSAQVRIVERDRLHALLREMAMVEAGQVDTNQAPRVGRLLGARRLVVGSISDLRNGQFGVETRLVNTVDGQISGAISARAPLASIFDAEKALVYRVFEEMGITLTPAERAAIEQRPTANSVALLAYSRGVRDEARGQYEAAASNFRAAVQADPAFNMARLRLQAVTLPTQTIAEAAPAPAASKPAEVAKVTTTAVGALPTSVGGGAAAAAAGAINPSPIGTLGAATNASTTQQQQSNQDKTAQAVRQPVFATIVIKVTQLP
jgi:hypothetical protein